MGGPRAWPLTHVLVQDPGQQAASVAPLPEAPHQPPVSSSQADPGEQTKDQSEAAAPLQAPCPPVSPPELAAADGAQQQRLQEQVLPSPVLASLSRDPRLHSCQRRQQQQQQQRQRRQRRRRRAPRAAQTGLAAIDSQAVQAAQPVEQAGTATQVPSSACAVQLPALPHPTSPGPAAADTGAGALQAQSPAGQPPAPPPVPQAQSRSSARDAAQQVFELPPLLRSRVNARARSQWIRGYRKRPPSRGRIGTSPWCLSLAQVRHAVAVDWLRMQSFCAEAARLSLGLTPIALTLLQVNMGRGKPTPCGLCTGALHGRIV